MIKMIVAVSENMVIGKGNTIPWSYPEDLKHFKKMTLNSTIIMGRNTFESLGSKPLPKRRNVVITRGYLLNAITFTNLGIAIEEAKTPKFNVLTNTQEEVSSDIWLIGGKSIYEEGMRYADEIHITRIPEYIEGVDVVKFPEIHSKFILKNREEIAENLYKEIYVVS